MIRYNRHEVSRMFTVMTIPIIGFFDACGDIKPGLKRAQFGDSIYIQSPNYPLQYPINADCQWHITVYSGLRIHLTFIDYDVEV